MYPDCDEILKMAPDYDIIPVCREIYADVITPITLLRKLAAVSKRYYLLESVEGGEKWGRYSFLGFDPVMRVKCSCGKVTIEKDGEETEKVTDKPLEVLREILKDYKAPRLEGLPPFAGGFVGYFAYAMIGYAEPKLNIKKGRVYVQAGGGIVADSIPENEYQESANKAAAVMNAIKAAKEVLE